MAFTNSPLVSYTCISPNLPLMATPAVEITAAEVVKPCLVIDKSIRFLKKKRGELFLRSFTLIWLNKFHSKG